MGEIDKLMDERLLPRENLLRWFLEHSLDDYLDQNSKTVIQSIKEDNPPIEVRDLLISKEISNKNRKEVLEILK